MTTELPDPFRARVAQAMTRYIAFRSATPKPGRDFLEWINKGDVEERILIDTLAQVWRDWKHRSPRTRGADDSYPFADWVISLFKDTDISPPTRDTIRTTLTRGKRQR